MPDGRVFSLIQSEDGQPVAGPVAAGRVLGSYLRQLREDAGLLLKDVAGPIGVSVSKLSRMERALHPLQETDVLRLLKFYSVENKDVHGAVRGLIQQSQAKEWWHQFSDVVPGWLERLIGMEASATEIRTYEVQYIPGLLQTPDYTRAVARSAVPEPSASRIERRVELRSRRQQVLTQADPPLYTALLDESLLIRPVGGKAVLRGQLRHLFNLAENKERIHIRIIPFSAAASGVAPSPSITYLRFTDGSQDDMVYLEQLDGGRYLSGQTTVEMYKYALHNLTVAAASRKDSMAMLQKYINALKD